MAVVTAVNTYAEIIRGDDAASTGTNQSNLFEAHVYGHNGATAVAGGADTLDFDLDAILEGVFRNGKTVTVRTVAVCQTARNTGGTAFAATVSLAAETASLTPKTPADWTTNATIAANGIGGAAFTDVGARPYGLAVCFEMV